MKLTNIIKALANLPTLAEEVAALKRQNEELSVRLADTEALTEGLSPYLDDLRRYDLEDFESRIADTEDTLGNLGDYDDLESRISDLEETLESEIERVEEMADGRLTEIEQGLEKPSAETDLAALEKRISGFADFAGRIGKSIGELLESYHKTLG